MRKLLILLMSCAAGCVMAADANWLTSVPEATSQASRENKLVLLDFTGSDWCGWCKKLVAETFSQAEFIDFASKNVVLVEVDFPSHKEQSDDLKQANAALKAKYSVSGFPTVVVMKPDGTVVWKHVGYLAGGPAAMIGEINKVRSGSVAAAAPATTAAARSVPIIYPAPPAHKPGDSPKISGILYSSRHASAVLNGRTCEEGDTIDGVRVVKISRDKVTVVWKGETMDLQMN